MKTVFIVERGDYSDRNIVGVFSSEEAVLTWIREQSPEHDDYDVSEWHLDPPSEWVESVVQYKSWVVLINEYVGDVRDVIEQEPGKVYREGPGVRTAYAPDAETAAKSVTFDWRVRQANEARKK